MLKNLKTFYYQHSLRINSISIILFSLVFTATIFSPQALADDSIFGTIAPPQGVDQINDQAGGIGIILFLSNLIRLITIVAGVWTMFNFIFAGWIYLNAAGDASANEKASQQMINSVIGLVIIALSYTIAGAIGLLVFGRADYILNPDLQTINELPTSI